jgi:hypothetical protein
MMLSTQMIGCAIASSSSFLQHEERSMWEGRIAICGVASSDPLPGSALGEDFRSASREEGRSAAAYFMAAA